MAEDTIVAEVRSAREALASQFNFDLHAMIQSARVRQKTGGRKVVSFPPTRWPQMTANEETHPASKTSKVEVTP